MITHCLVDISYSHGTSLLTWIAHANPVQQLFIVNRWKKSRVHSGSRDLSVKIGNRGILPLVKKRIERYRVRGLMFLWIFVLDFVGIWSVKRYESYFKKIEFSTCSVFFVESSLNGNKKKNNMRNNMSCIIDCCAEELIPITRFIIVKLLENY